MTSNLQHDFNDYRKRLSDWLKFLGLPNNEPQSRSEIEAILEMSLEDIRSKTVIELAEYAFMLSQYSLFLQNKFNENNSFIKWSQQECNRLISGEEKTKLLNWQKVVNERLEILSYISRKIDTMTFTLQNLCKIRNGVNNECN